MFTEQGPIKSLRRDRCFQKDPLGRLLAQVKLEAKAVQVLMRKGPKMRERAVREVPEPAELVAELIVPY